MPEQTNYPFKYLVFDCFSERLLGHGQTAALAALSGDQIAPRSHLRIIAVETSGQEIWDRDLRLSETQKLLDNLQKT